jgi:dTMP kinase
MYVCIEGGEGSYKTTTTKALAEHYRSRGLKVLETKEPGTSLLPVTMKLRELMLSNEYDSQLSSASRELISQAIRSIHIEKLIIPSLIKEEYDLIIQDRGVLSGSIYADACGIHSHHVRNLEEFVLEDFYQRWDYLYDHIFVFHNSEGLEVAKSAKDEFGVGDAMESRGESFHNRVNKSFMTATSEDLSSTCTAYTISHHDVMGKTTDMLVSECAKILSL